MREYIAVEEKSALLQDVESEKPQPLWAIPKRAKHAPETKPRETRLNAEEQGYLNQRLGPRHARAHCSAGTSVSAIPGLHRPAVESVGKGITDIDGPDPSAHAATAKATKTRE